MSINVAWVMAMMYSFDGEHAYNKRQAEKTKIARLRKRPPRAATNRVHSNPDNE
jgi:hypothetical protein